MFSWRQLTNTTQFSVFFFKEFWFVAKVVTTPLEDVEKGGDHPFQDLVQF
jgi:hypothetical protein